MPEFNFISVDEVAETSFIKIQRELIKGKLFKTLSAESKLLYALLRDRVDLSIKNKWVDDKGHVFIIYSGKEIDEDLGCSKNSRIKYLSELEDFGLISKKHNKGYADWIYVHNLQVINSGSNIEPPSGAKNEPPPAQNLNQGGTNFEPESDLLSQPYFGNQTDSFFPDQTDQDEKNDGRNERTPSTTSYERVEVDREAWSEFLKLGFHLAYSDGAIYKSLFECLMRILENPKSTINVHGKPEDYDRVIQRLCRISESDLDYAATMVSRFKSPIRNPNAFYTTVLFDCVGNGDAGMIKLAEADLQKGEWSLWKSEQHLA